MIEKNQPKIAILVALKEEFKTLTPFKQKSAGKNAMWLSDNIYACRTGMGPANAKTKTEELIDNGFGLIISWGTAVALKKELAAGSLCIPHQIITAMGENIKITNHWHKQMQRHLTNRTIDFSYAPLAEASEVLINKAQKDTLFNRTKAIAADMESAAIARTAKKYNIPFLVIRSISDTSDMVLPMSIRLSTSEGEIKISRFLKQLVLHPSDWGLVFRLALTFRKARKTLNRVARELLPFWTKQNFKNYN